MSNGPFVNRRSQVEVGYKFQVGERFLIFTQVDRQLNEARVKFFDSLVELDDWEHSVSLPQYPSWHKNHCPRCNPEKYGAVTTPRPGQSVCKHNNLDPLICPECRNETN